MIVSIITVVFNGVKTIEQTILSVSKQTYKNVEYIIIDGGSSDGTIEVIRKYEKYISFWISEPDKGLYDAMNKGIGYAKGEIIGIINSDDWYEPNAIELIVEAYKLNPDKKIFHGDRFDIFENGTKRIRKFNPSRLKFLNYGMTYNHPSMFVHKEIYRDISYNISLKALSDYEFVLKLFLRDRTIFKYIPIAYVNYRLDGISAKMKFLDSINEGFISRKNANLFIVNNLFSVFIRIFITLNSRLIKNVFMKRNT